MMSLRTDRAPLTEHGHYAVAELRDVDAHLGLSQ